jgi:hypothetical protein
MVAIPEDRFELVFSLCCGTALHLYLFRYMDSFSWMDTNPGVAMKGWFVGLLGMMFQDSVTRFRGPEMGGKDELKDLSYFYVAMMQFASLVYVMSGVEYAC